MQRLDTKTSGEVCGAIARMLLSVVGSVLTVTSDSGKEIAGHAQEALGAAFCFACRCSS